MFDSYWLSYYARDLGYLIQVFDFLANHFVGLGASHLPLSPDGKDSGAIDSGSIVFYLVSTSKICYSNFVNVSSMYHHALVEYTVLLLNHLVSYFHYYLLKKKNKKNVEVHYRNYLVFIFIIEKIFEIKNYIYSIWVENSLFNKLNLRVPVSKIL